METDTVKEFRISNDYSAGASLGTRIFGTAMFRKGKIAGIRHTISPNVAFNYRPDYSQPRFKYYNEYQSDSAGSISKYSIFENGVSSGPSSGKYGFISFGADNNVELKMRQTTDTAVNFKKVKLLESLSFSSGYNMSVKTFNWSVVNVNARSTILQFVNVFGACSFDPETAGVVASSSPEATTSVLQLTTNPGGADVYLDGEFIGRSDASGRLVRRGVFQGSHEIRVGGVAGFLERRDVVQVAGATFERIVLLDRQAAAEVAGGGGLSPAILLGGISLIVVLSIAGFRMTKGRTDAAASASPRTQLAQTQLTANPAQTASMLTRVPDSPTGTLSVAPATPMGSTFGGR